jgi:UDP-N-acetylmuramyl tripeptide synthase
VAVPTRTRVAMQFGAATAGLSRWLGRGDGTVIGGRVTLALDRRALARLGAGQWVALVSGTNGKTTTTRLLTGALATLGPVVTNPQGSNLPPGLVAGLARANRAPRHGRAALEVDEAWLGSTAAEVAPAAIALLNLSRDQLDRTAEVRRLSDRWRAAVAATPRAMVVANADDPLVVWAASAAAQVTWVGAGQPWREDSTACPSCGGLIDFGDPVWACASCGFARPLPSVWVDGDAMVTGENRWPLRLALPGRANRANAVMATVTAGLAGVEAAAALAAMETVTEVDGRYRRAPVGAAQARLLLAKNPAGWLEALDMLAAAPTPVVVVINARVADGRDPSWLWDVDFARLEGRPVVAAGERSRDLAVRLEYAGIPHRRIDDPLEAVVAMGPGPVDVAANYTAMRELNHRLGVAGA